jgi:NTE family protein
MIRTTMLPWTARPGVLAALAMAPGRLSTAWLERQTEWLLGGKRWPERDLWLCAVDVETGRRVVFGSDGGPRATPGEAVAASCAIPGVFAPVSIGRRLYLDGGAWSPTNADVLAGRRLDLVIVVSPMSLAHGRESRSGDDWIRAACGAALAAEVAVLRCHGTRVAVIEPAPDDARVMGRIIGLDVLDEGRCRDVVGQVRRSTAARIRAGSIPGLELLRSGDAAYNPGSTVGLGLAA